MKIGLFGGTFNPVHSGHLLIAEWIRCQIEINTVYFIPTAVPPHRSEDNSIIDIEHRCAMVRLAIEDNPHFKIADYESNPESVSYAVDTIREFRENMQLSKESMYYMIGADNLLHLAAWKEQDALSDMCKIVVARRPSVSMEEVRDILSDQIIVQSPLIDISASDIRKRISKNSSIRYMVPSGVESYIHTHKLYGAGNDR